MKPEIIPSMFPGVLLQRLRNGKGPTLLLMQGASGCGKSSIVARLRGVATSADFFFMHEGQYLFDAKKLGQAHLSCQNRTAEALVAGEDVVIVDNTNICASDVVVYWGLAELMDATVFVLRPGGADNAEFCHGRQTKNLPRYVVENQVKKMEDLSVTLPALLRNGTPVQRIFLPVPPGALGHLCDENKTHSITLAVRGQRGCDEVVLQETLALTEGTPVTVKGVVLCRDDNCSALSVTLEGAPCASGLPHVTLSCAPGVQPFRAVETVRTGEQTTLERPVEFVTYVRHELDRCAGGLQLAQALVRKFTEIAHQEAQ